MSTSYASHMVLAGDVYDDTALAPCPAGCGRKVFVRFRTDGNGTVIEDTDECPCSRSSRIVRIPAGHKRIVCRSCDHTFAVPRSRGRYPSLCPTCR